MEALVWSNNEINFMSAVSGTKYKRKLAFRVGIDLSLYIGADEIGPMIEALHAGMELLSKQILEDQQVDGAKGAN